MTQNQDDPYVVLFRELKEEGLVSPADISLGDEFGMTPRAFILHVFREQRATISQLKEARRPGSMEDSAMHQIKPLAL